MTVFIKGKKYPGQRMRKCTGALVVVIALAAGSLLAPGSAGAEPWETKKFVKIEVPTEGAAPVKLAGKVLLPSTPGSYPTIIMAHPYGVVAGGRSPVDGVVSAFPSLGYAVLVLDVRGTGASDGVFCLFCAQEQRDILSVIDWITRQSWSNGDVGLFGPSYPGILSLLVAAKGHPAVKAVVAINSYSDIYREAIWHNGMLNQLFIAQWSVYQGALSGAGGVAHDDADDPMAILARYDERRKAPANFEYAMQHPYDDDWHQERSIYPKLKDITVPVLLVDGWGDGFARGAIQNFKGLASKNKKLVMFPWGHSLGGYDANNPWSGASGFDPTEPQELDTAYREMRNKKIKIENDWFARFLKGVDNGTEDGPSVEYYDAVSGRQTFATSFPPQGSSLKTFFLSGDKSGSAVSKNDGSLSTQLVTESSAAASDSYEYVPSYGSSQTLGKWGEVAAFPTLRVDQRADETQSLTYTSPPLDQELELAGPMELRFFASTTAEDTDWVVKVSDVAPLEDCSGTNYSGEDRNTANDCSTLVTSGYLRASRYEVDDSKSGPAAPWIINQRSLPVKDQVTEYRIDVWPTAWTLQPGDRLRVTISSSDVPNHTPSEHAATNTIYHDSKRPSRLILTAKSSAPPAMGLTQSLAHADDRSGYGWSNRLQ